MAISICRKNLKFNRKIRATLAARIFLFEGLNLMTLFVWKFFSFIF